jgi:hypothetical protein
MAAIVTGVTVILKLLGALFLLPRVTVESSGPYDPSNPTPISFTISNNNVVPLRNIQPGIGLCFLEFAALNGSEQHCNGSASPSYS